MAGVYRPRHPERTELYRLLFHYFDQFLQEYESRFEKKYGFLQPIIKEVVERITNHLKLTFLAERAPPPHVVSLEFLMDLEAPADYFS